MTWVGQFFPQDIPEVFQRWPRLDREGIFWSIMTGFRFILESIFSMSGFYILPEETAEADAVPVNWDDWNFPSFFPICHFDLKELPEGSPKRTVARDFLSLFALMLSFSLVNCKQYR